MAVHGVDVSRYQDAEAIDGWGFAIVNVEDPGLGAKVDRAKRLGIPWGLYTWVYPGAARRDMLRALSQAAPLGAPPMGFWLDYEQAGVRPADLAVAFDTAAEHGVLERTGVYTYLSQVAQIADHLRGRPLWLAYYPGANDGSFPADRDGDARKWGAVMWQYSSGQNLDRNVVLDDAWYRAWIEGDEDLTPDQAAKLNAIFDTVAWPGPTTANVNWIKAYLQGVPGVFGSIEERISSGAAPPVAVDAAAVAEAIVAELGDGLAREVADELAERLTR